ncbi:nicotinate-nucleotide adenylyltransferase [Emcibacter nanhaiensis]|uniref:Probable nicotinate-nucleotide adenylyltransferase n=1 Tax=Emcibacter nanhaiensis TaxID=1505037 RepID=A0A501PPE2_9PROT|nr:nicotinate-nucleotide adenylyltransferase [Emcibacter nanhaiensis]TPD61641.1 nicotinate-nucleotide adenylyltransferase [Emcibacter nanhaiensis]
MVKPAPENKLSGKFPLLPGRNKWRGMTIGLLGGSFNPAHAAHREISLAALKRLRLDHVWWLVSPQNPLKGTGDMASLADRVAKAREVAAHPHITVMDLEKRMRTNYTADTLRILVERFPDVRFVWLMGADNLGQFDKWQKWEQIAELVPFAIFDRPGYSMMANASKTAQRFHRQRLSETQAPLLPGMKPPAWVFCHGRKNPLSATAIREKSLYSERL